MAIRRRMDMQMGYEVFAELSERDHEQVVFCNDKVSGLKAIIGIHNTTLGPALGGCRMYPYANEEDALLDVLRLSRAMTQKNAAAGIHLGGGKSVIIGDPKKDKSEALFRAFGKAVGTLSGRYITAEDVGTNEEDMDHIYAETDHVTGMSPAYGGSGDPSPVTALGVFQGVRASVEFAFGSNLVKGRTVAVQGLGSVGSNLCRLLKEHGAHVIACEIDVQRAKEVAASIGIDEIVDPSDIFDVDCDVFSPCAMGGAINEKTIDRLKCKVVAGAANNQLADDGLCDILEARQIIYAPDFVINAGGVINMFAELQGYNRAHALSQTENIFRTTTEVFRLASKFEESTLNAAKRLVTNRLETARLLTSRYNPYPGRGAFRRTRRLVTNNT